MGEEADSNVNPSNVLVDEGDSMVCRTDLELLARMRQPAVLLTIVSAIGSAGSIIGLVLAGRTIRDMILHLPAQYDLIRNVTPFVVGAIHAGLMAVVYAVLAWYLWRYCECFDPVSRGARLWFRRLLERQRLALYAMSWAAFAYLAMRLLGAVAVAMVNSLS